MELHASSKEWIVTFHKHDSLLENIEEQELSEEEKKAAWEDYERSRTGRLGRQGIVLLVKYLNVTSFYSYHTQGTVH